MTLLFLFLVGALAIAVVVAVRARSRPGSKGIDRPSMGVKRHAPVLASILTPTADLIELCRHWSGYEREAAVRALVKRGNVAALPAFLERANDWVPQVRAAAAEAIDALLVAANADAVVRTLPALDRLKERRRTDHSGLVRRIEDFLVQPDHRAQLLAGLQHDDPRIRRACLRLCSMHGLLKPGDLVRTALSSSDVSVRRLAATKLHELGPDALREILPIVLKDRFMPIRREALHILLQDPAKRNADVLTPWLFDRHYSVRELAMHYCERAQLDATAVYRAELDNPSASVHRIRCALLGLAALRDEAALPAIHARLNATFPRIRQAALVALAWRPSDRFEDLCLRSLLDSSSAVVRTAKSLLLRAGTPIDTAKLVELASRPIADSGFHSCLLLTRRASKWNHLTFLLRLTSYVDKDGARAQQLIDELQRWDSDFNRTQTAVTPDQLSQLAASLSAAQAAIPEPLVKAIAFTLRVAKS